ncbi:hypothetical protein WK72_16375 [Burkholderia ubonensis]|uniref:hypothetical protein n=1 Tax=Burkholderia ubonensis TaxID=101571 RepID=UPI00075E096D|nr:hypothetical protein [Burkholderia ubonensis]KVU67826.1 hypothetical protein WK72_16375 [Burkholderia ubonensis]
MTDQAIHAAHINKAREIIVAAVKRMRAAHVNCADLMEQAEQYLHATRATDNFHAVYDGDLEFEPSEQRSIADLANIGGTLLERIAAMLPGYSWIDSPAEVISDLINERDEAIAAQAAARTPLTDPQRAAIEFALGACAGHPAGERHVAALESLLSTESDAGDESQHHHAQGGSVA